MPGYSPSLIANTRERSPPFLALLSATTRQIGSGCSRLAHHAIHLLSRSARRQGERRRRAVSTAVASPPAREFGRLFVWGNLLPFGPAWMDLPSQVRNGARVGAKIRRLGWERGRLDRPSGR